jgi:dipeptidyl aminopeptidase/acylaminoacyl peptidase
MRDITLGEAEQFSFAGWNGETVHGYVVKPADFDPTRTYPVAFIIHGGPQGSSGNHWHYRWNPQVYAGAGYAVVMIDFHGSTGYGQAFTDSIRGDWGGKPLEDLQKGLAYATAHDTQLEADNACAAGGSYGGYMMNWIEGRWPDRFKCIVQHDGVFDARAMAYETEELWFDEWEHGGHAYYEAPQEFEKWNPVNYVADWKTPQLVITSEKDFRIPYTQGIAAFTALQRRNIPSKLLILGTTGVRTVAACARVSAGPQWTCRGASDESSRMAYDVVAVVSNQSLSPASKRTSAMPGPRVPLSFLTKLIY